MNFIIIVSVSEISSAIKELKRIEQPWVPPGVRPLIPQQRVREYIYAYTAVSPDDGENFSLILPHSNKEMMDIFPEEFSEQYKDYRVIIATDGAPWHLSECSDSSFSPAPAFSDNISSRKNDRRPSASDFPIRLPTVIAGSLLFNRLCCSG